MGWLFNRKKKVPQVPFPQGHTLDPGTLRFPDNSREKIIEPDHVKQAAGLTKSNEPKDMHEETLPNVPDLKLMDEELPPSRKLPVMPEPSGGEPLFVKVDVYQRILGELGSLRENLSELGVTNRELENSEYNEEANFDKLRKTMKNLHDKLLQTDNILFKT